MRYVVVVPGALLPAAIAPAVSARLEHGPFARRLARGRSQVVTPSASDGAPHLAWLWSRFGGRGTPVTAPYAWRALDRHRAAALSATAALWHADPVHFALARDHVLVTALTDAPPDRDETEALASQAAAAAAECGAALHVCDEGDWFIAFDPPWSIEAVPLTGALGRSAYELMPSGADAARWRKLLTEIQMRWHTLPLNAKREAEGRPTINGLWLHGGGAWQPLRERPFVAVVADDPVMQGWAMASGATVVDAAGADDVAPVGDVLAYFPALAAAHAAQDWDGWVLGFERLGAVLEARVKRAFARGFERVELALAGRHRLRLIELRASDRLRFWHATPLADCLAEPE